MRCELYRTDPAALIEALSSERVLRDYLAAQEAEIPVIADRPLVAFLRRLNGLAAQALASGMTALAKRDPAHTDALLTDLFAVATWNHWDLPIERLPESEVETDGLQRGILGADPGREGASLWLMDHATIALARAREAADVAEWDHDRHGGGCQH
jgi:hypothetical protein